jgi:uncharacterized LabA/DUF88 family protein
MLNLVAGERTILHLDGLNLYSASRNLGFDIDYKQLLEFFAKKTQVVRAYYYSTILENEDYTPLKPLTAWLSYNGYYVVSKPAKEFTDKEGKRRIKGSMEIELAVDMLEMAPKIGHAILFSGDADYRRLVEAVQRQGVRVTVISSLKSSPPTIADELRRQADAFVDLADIAQFFTRKASDRPGREAVDSLVQGR